MGEFLNSLRQRKDDNGRKTSDHFHHKIDVDHILKDYVGHIGVAQILMVLVHGFTLPPAIIFPVFGNTELPHRCRLEDELEDELQGRFAGPQGDKFDEIAALVGPWPNSESPQISEHPRIGCFRYAIPLRDAQQNRTRLLAIPCNRGYVYKYSTDQYPGGIVNEWDLVCDRAWMGPFSISMYMVGMMVGFITGGMAGDHFGRRHAALVACIFENLSIITVSFSNDYWFYILSRFVLASASSIKMAVLLVLCMEVTTARQRSIVNGIWSLIHCFLLRVWMSPLAYWFTTWQWLHGMSCMLSFVSFPLIFLFPESPRWLISKNRKMKALCELYKIYVVNQKMKWSKNKSPLMTEEEFINLIAQEADASRSHALIKPPLAHPKANFLDTLKSFKFPKMIRITFQCVFLFAGQLATNFGLLFYGNSIRANIYLVNFLNSATQVPGTIISCLMYRYCKKRKMPIIGVYVGSTIVLCIAAIYNLIVKPDSDFVLNICCNISLILLAAGLNMVFMYVPELFVSEARTLGLGVASGLGRIGGVLCPFINALDTTIFHGLPIIIYIGVHMLQLLNLFWLPDTSGRNLLDNFEFNKDKELVLDDVIEVSEGSAGNSNEEYNIDSQPVWASTMDELIASTHVIQHTSDLNEDEETEK